MRPNFKCLVIAGLFICGLQAQDIVGVWQGEVAQRGAASSRLVAKIDRDARGTLRATVYNADRSAPVIPVSTIGFQGSTLRMTLPTMNATYEGKLSSDGKAIIGVLTEAMPTPLDFARATLQTAWPIPDPPSPIRPMGDDTTPRIEVATIKSARPGARNGGILVARNGTITATNGPVIGAIAMAYGVNPRQVTGGPSWVESENFDITIKPDPEGVPNSAQTRILFQTLLADRLQLRAHIEKREQSVYALTVARGGLKMTEADPPRGNSPSFGIGPANLRINNATMAEVARVLNSVVGRTVVDRTGIVGRYDCLLRFMPSPEVLAQLPANERPPEDAAPDVYSALERQAGLHLEPAKAPVDFVVIDKIEKPSEN